MYPLVAGQEITGIVSELGPGVSKFEIGDRVAMGHICHVSENGEITATYNSVKTADT
jgi:alcohol dehydrogenase (NADP+)